MVRYGFTRLQDQSAESDNMASTPLMRNALATGDAEKLPKEMPTKVDQRAFRDGYEPAEGDVFIAVLGQTGAGKSTFISKCSEKEVSIGSLADLLCSLPHKTLPPSQNPTMHLAYPGWCHDTPPSFVSL